MTPEASAAPTCLLHRQRGPVSGCSACEDARLSDLDPPRHQLVDDVVRDLVSEYPGTIQSVNLPTPDSALMRLHRGDSVWLVSIARLAVTDG